MQTNCNATRHEPTDFCELLPQTAARSVPPVPKRRIDLLLVERELAPTRARAQALVLAGKVYVGERRIDKAGSELDVSSEITVREAERYVSRGGHKLEGALDRRLQRLLAATRR
jgi:ribosomal protein S4